MKDMGIFREYNPDGSPATDSHGDPLYDVVRCVADAIGSGRWRGRLRCPGQSLPDMLLLTRSFLTVLRSLTFDAPLRLHALAGTIRSRRQERLPSLLAACCLALWWIISGPVTPCY